MQAPAGCKIAHDVRGHAAAANPRGTSIARAMAVVFVLLACGFVAAGCGDEAKAGGGVPQIGFPFNRDPTGFMPGIVKKCNEKANGKYRIEPIFSPPTVDAQREQLIRRLAGKDPALDILPLDVIWTAEFSDAGWIYDLTDRIEPEKDRYVPAALNTVFYKDKYWAVPVGTNVAVLYYRTDLVKKPPQTWEELVKAAKAVQQKHPDMAGFLFQANQYEGLTVDIMEFTLSAKGGVLSEDGKEAILDSPETIRGWTFMQNLFKDGVTPKQVTTFQEEESRQMFQQGKAVFLRNWPYVYALANGPDSKIKGKFDVVPLPRFQDGQNAGVLGGVNYAISRFSDHPELTWEAIQCIASEENARQKLLIKGDMPALEAPYTDPEVKKKVPFIGTVREALNSAYSRPVTPYYNDVTYALSRAANDVAAQRKTPEEGIRKADRGIQLAIEGRAEI